MTKLRGLLILVVLLIVVGLSVLQIKKEEITPTPEENLAQVPPTSGLILNYNFTGGQATDSSGNGLNGTVSGATASVGISGDALSFDGVNDSVAMGSPAALDDLGPVTISFWIKPVANGYIISKRDSSCTGYWRLAYENNTIHVLNNRGYHGSAATTLPTDSWSHVVYTWDGTKNSTGTKIYINSQDQTSLGSAGTATTDASCNMYLGARTGSTEYFTGAMDELYIYNRVLSPSEISSLYNLASGSPSPTPPPTTTAAPTLNFTASPNPIVAGGTSRLTWTSTDTTSCALDAGGSSDIAQPTNGFYDVSPTQTQTYLMKCVGPAGSAIKTVQVQVNASPSSPSLSLTATPTSITAGGSSILSWSSANVTNCTASGAWSGNKTIPSGSESVSPTVSSTYILACTGTSGTVSQSVTVSVGSSTPPPSATFRAPDLPQVYVDTSMPSVSGKVISVAPGDSAGFKSALTAALPGDIIELAAGSTYRGNFKLPNKNSNGQWIIIRSSAYNSLPSPGIRVKPSDSVYMPKIVSINPSNAIVMDPGAGYYRLVGLDITDDGIPSQYGPLLPDGTRGGLSYGLVDLGDIRNTSLSLMAHHTVIDRSYIHGQPTTHGKYGVTMNGTHLAVVDSYFSDFHGVGQDTQAIHAANGTGPLKIVNNYLEGAGENFITGGGNLGIVGVLPKDIEIRGNYFFKPLSWKIGDPTYAGIHWAVKNLFELKIGERILVEGNVFENNWNDGQNGFAILIKGASQQDKTPWVYTKHVTFRNNIVKNSESALNLCGDCTINVQQSSDWWMVNNLFLDIHRTAGGNEGFAQLLDNADYVTIEKNTALQTGGSLLKVGGPTPSDNFIMRDNIALYGPFGISIPTTAGGIPGALITKNVVIGQALSSSLYPGNYNSGTIGGVGFVGGSNPVTPNDFVLSSNSPFKGKASDGGDPGVNIPAVLAATQYAISGGGSPTPPPPPPSAPTLTLTASPTSIISGQSSVLTWSATNATSCSASWTSSTGIFGNQSVSPTATTTYAMTCTGAGGTVTKSATVTVTSTPPPTAPTVSLSASPTSIQTGQSSTLTWSATNATSCSASWTSSTGIFGNQSVSPTVTTTYNMTCTGAGGSANGSTTVTVTAAPTPPSTKFMAGDRVIVSASESVNVRSTGSTSGTLLGTQASGALGTIVSGGQYADGYYWWNVNYDVAPDGWSVENYLADYVAPPPPPPAPTVSLSASPTSISTGQSSTLTWSSTNATSCSANWTSSTGISGNASVSPTVTTTYSITCTGAGGSASGSATVTVATVTTPPSQTPWVVGDWVEVTANKLNIRVSPSSSASKTGMQSLGAKASVVGGPTNADGYRWWNLNFSSGADGWAVEDYLKKTTAPTSIAVGSTVYTTTRVNVRALPSTSADRVGRQNTNSQGTVIGGPETADGYTWWQVDFVSGTDGWVAGVYLR